MLRRLLTIAIAAYALTFSAYGQAAAPAKKATTKAADTATKGKAAAAGTLIDINSAKAEDLEALPGIGKAYSKKIVDGRPYANKSQLVSKGVLPQKVYDKVADKIIAKQ